MAKSHIVYLTDHHVKVETVTPDGLELNFIRSYKEGGWQELFKSFLVQDDLANLFIFIDVMGEEIRYESFPHVSGNDRELLLKRKMKSAFPSADFTWRHHQGRKKGERKDDTYLMLGVTLPDSVRDALAVLEESGKAIFGVYFLSALQQQLSPVFPRSPQYLIVSSVDENNNSKQSYRQTYYKDNSIKLSRLNNLDGNDESDKYSKLLKEIERTYQFLVNSRQIEPGLALSVIVVLEENEAARLIHLNSSSNIQMKYASLKDLALRIGIKKEFKIYTLPELLCVLAIRKQIKPHSQPKGLCKQHRVKVTRKHLNWSSLIILAMAFIASSFLWINGDWERHRSEQIESSLLRYIKQRDTLSSNMPATEVPPKVMSQSVEIYEELRKSGRKPEDVFEVIAKAYDGYQDMELSEIRWIGEVSLVDKEITSDFALDGSFVQRLMNERQMQIVIRPDSRLSAREMLQRVNGFSASLLRQPEISAVIREKSAIDTSSSGLMEGSFGKERSDQNPDFILQVTFKAHE